MPFLEFLFQPKNELEQGGRSAAPVQSDEREPEKTCPNCHNAIPLSRLWAGLNVCPCGYHFRMGVRARLRYLADKGTFRELFSEHLMQINDGDYLITGHKKTLDLIGRSRHRCYFAVSHYLFDFRDIDTVVFVSYEKFEQFKLVGSAFKQYIRFHTLLPFRNEPMIYP